jgi:hypothetical protein
MAKELLEVEARLNDQISKQMKKLEGQIKTFAKANKRSFAEVKKETIATFAAQGKFNKAAALQGKRLVTLANGTKRYETRLQTANRLLKENAANLNRASGAVRTKTSFIKRMTQSFIASAAAMVGMIFSLTQLIRLAKSITGGIFNAGVAIEQFTVSLQALSGSAEVADRQLRKIREFAAKSPLETKDVTEAFVKLKAVGIPATFEVSKALGNVGLVFGRTLDEVSTAFISLNKRVLRRFGVIVDRMGKKAVISMSGIRKEVEKNDLAIRQGLLEIWEEKYAGALEIASNTTTARLAVMRSQFFELGASIALGVNPKIRVLADLVTTLTEKIRSVFFIESLPLEQQIEMVGKRIQDIEQSGNLEKIGKKFLQLQARFQILPPLRKAAQALAKFTGAGDDVDELRKKMEDLNEELERAADAEAAEKLADQELLILSKVANFRAELAAKNTKLQIKNLKEERDRLLVQAKAVVQDFEASIDAREVIRQRFNDKILELQKQLRDKRKKEQEKQWKEETNRIKERSKRVIQTFKDEQKEIIAIRSAQDELDKRRIQRQQDELERFKNIGIQIANSFANITIEQTEIVIDKLVIMAKEQRKTVEQVFSELQRQATLLETFALNLGAAIASGFGKGAKGLKESLKNTLITILDFFERKIMLGFVGAGLDAIIFKNPAGLIKMVAVKAAFEAAKAGVAAFQGGTPFAPGGPAVIDERGPEMVDLPRGTRVINNKDTRNMFNVNVAGSTFNITGTPSPEAITQIRRADAARVSELEELFRKGRIDPTRLIGLQTAS